MFLSVVLVAALLWAFCGRTLLGQRLAIWRTSVVVQTCSGNSQSICHSSSIPLSHHVTHLFYQSFTCLLSPLLLFGARFASFIVLTGMPLHPLVFSASSSLPYIIQKGLSLPYLFSFPRSCSALSPPSMR